MIIKRSKSAYQVRVSPYPARTLPTREAAEAVELDLKLKKKLGDLYQEPATRLGDEIAGYIARKRSMGGRRGQLRPRSIEFLERSARFWEPLAEMPVSLLRRPRIEDLLSVRAGEHPRSARNELELLKAVLREARDRGQRVDESLFRIPSVWHHERDGVALTVDELDELASWAPDYIRRIVAFAGTSGARASELFTLTDRQLDLRAATMTVPRLLNKSRRDKTIPLTGSEVQLLREQLLARPRATALVFPKSNGLPWNRHHFRWRIWVPLLETTAEHWRAEHPSSGLTPYDDLHFHDLRHTATSLMCTAGLRPELVAERRGDADGGALILKRYRHLYPSEMSAAAATLDGYLAAARQAVSDAARDKERTA